MERDDKDYAIEHGYYLAEAAERYLSTTLGKDEDMDAIVDALRALKSAIHEFRKRANRATAA